MTKRFRIERLAQCEHDSVPPIREGRAFAWEYRCELIVESKSSVDVLIHQLIEANINPDVYV